MEYLDISEAAVRRTEGALFTHQPTAPVYEAREPCFGHEPLDLNITSIRLVDVLPSGLNGAIQCTIKHVTIDRSSFDDTAATNLNTDVPEYTCLSYVWGPPKPLHRITINGKYFEISENLWDFLNAMHSAENLWIDALCIDQQNVAERNHQVQHMGWIYSNANVVLVWMGDNLSIARLFSIEQEQGWYVTTRQGRYMLLREHADYARTLCDDPYWNRAWITQELLLARELHFIAQGQAITLERLKKVAHSRLYGDTRIEIRNVARRNFRSHVLATPGRPYSALNKLKVLLDRIANNSQSSTLVENLERFRDKDTSNRRDRIYSLRDISRDGARLLVDYLCPLADLARDVLTVTESKICLRRAFVVLRSLQFHYDLSTVDAMTSLLKTEVTIHTHPDEPCQQCGEKWDTQPSWLSHPSTATIVSDRRYICLHCDHSLDSVPIMTHRRCHYGHLMFFQRPSTVERSLDWGFYWSAVGHGGWQELLGDRYAIYDQDGILQSIVFSIGVVRELMQLISPLGNLDDPRYLGLSYTSKWVTEWKAASEEIHETTKSEHRQY